MQGGCIAPLTLQLSSKHKWQAVPCTAEYTAVRVADSMMARCTSLLTCGWYRTTLAQCADILCTERLAQISISDLSNLEPNTVHLFAIHRWHSSGDRPTTWNPTQTVNLARWTVSTGSVLNRRGSLCWKMLNQTNPVFSGLCFLQNKECMLTYTCLLYTSPSPRD